MKNNFLKIGIVLLLLIVAGCGTAGDNANSSNEAKQLIVGSSYPTDDPLSQALHEKFKTIVEDKTNGSIEVDIQDSGKLGSEEEMFVSTKSGAMQMTILGSGTISDSAPQLDVVTLPYLFQDFQDAQDTLLGPIGEELVSDYENTGLKHLGITPGGFKSYSSNKKLETIDDFKGLKLRIASGYPIQVELAKAMGINATPLPGDEIYTSLETGVVEAQENPIDTIFAFKFYEVQDYLFDTKHFFSVSTYGMNKDFWDSLTEEEQAIVEEAANEAVSYSWTNKAKSTKEAKDELEEVGMEVSEPSSELREKLINKTEPVYEWYYEKNPWAEELVEKILAE